MSCSCSSFFSSLLMVAALTRPAAFAAAPDRALLRNVPAAVAGDEVTFVHQENAPVWVEGPQGTYEATIAIRRYYGAEDERRQQTARQLLPENAVLLMPLYDCDRRTVWAGMTGPTEQDQLFVNGHFISTLEGQNQTWTIGAYAVPCEALHFPARPGESAANRITIVVDSAGTTPARGLGLAWQALLLPAPRPLYLVASNADGPDGLEQLQQLVRRQLGIPCQRRLLDAEATPEDHAATLASELRLLTAEYGVRQFNLLAYGVSGLDARVLLDSASPGGLAAAAVHALLQLAVPNGGCPLADLLPTQSEPLAGWQRLRPAACRAFNRLYTFPQAPIHTLGGSVADFASSEEWDDDGDGQPGSRSWDYRLFACCSYAHSYHAEPRHWGDGLVPVSSAHALGTALAASPVFLDGTQQADHRHIAIEGAPAVLAAFQRILGETVQPAAVPVRPTTLPAAEPGVESALPQEATQTILTATVPAGARLDLPFHVFSPGPLCLLLAVQGDGWSAGVTSPDGTVTALPRLDAPDLPETPGLTWAFTELATAATGDWCVSLDASGSPVALPVALTAATPAAAVQLTAWQEEPSTPSRTLEFHAYAECFDTLCTGDDLQFTLDYRPVASPGKAFTRLNLRDDGQQGDAVADDGLYTLVFTPDAPGEYDIRIHVDGLFAGHPARRRQSLRAAALGTTGKIAESSLTETLVVKDGDALAERLRLKLLATVDAPGIYRLSARLGIPGATAPLASAADWVTAEAPGELSFCLDFDGACLYEAAISGPLQLSRVTLEQLLDGTAVPLDTLPGVLTTHAYDAPQFFHPVLQLTGQSQDWLEDPTTEFQTRYNTLAVCLELLVAPNGAGVWQFGATLTDRDGQVLCCAPPETVTLETAEDPARPQAICLAFSGAAIREHGLDGPYLITGLYAWQPDSQDGRLVWLAGSFETQAYNATNFSLDTTPVTLKADEGVLLTDITGPDAAGHCTATLTYTHAPARFSSRYLQQAVLLEEFAVALDAAGTPYHLAHPVNTCEYHYEYQDHTEEALAQLAAQGNGDCCLNAGETLTFQVQYTTQADAGPPDFLLAIRALYPMGRQLQPPRNQLFHPLDADCDGRLSPAEIHAGWLRWRLGAIDHATLLSAIALQNDSYSFDPVTRRFQKK